jgi:3-methyladenine DNA glycosylase/8-oxoguanine DNA glycosylase
MNTAVDFESYLSKKDPKLGPVIKLVRAHRGTPMRPPASTHTPFQALVRAVIYQRVSVSVGETVYARLQEITEGDHPAFCRLSNSKSHENQTDRSSEVPKLLLDSAATGLGLRN